MNELLSLILPLFLTLLIETPIYFFFLKIKKLRGLFTLILMNVFTNLLMNIIYLKVLSSLIFIYIYEIIIPFIEGSFLFLYLYKFDYVSSSLKIKTKPLILYFYVLIISLLSNTSSYFIGEIFNKYIYINYYNFYIVLIYLLIFILEILIMIIYLIKRHKP